MQTAAVALDHTLGGLLAAVGFAAAPGAPGYALFNITIAQTAAILPYVLLVLMLIFRPRGLLGTRE
jgi:branched-chain amino acid transport system permease protein